MGAELVISQMV